jgi:hypothetical protein
VGAGTETGTGTGAGTTSGTGTSAGAATTSVLGEKTTRSVGGATTTGGLAGGSTAVSPSSTQLPFTGSNGLPLLALLGGAGIATGAGLVRTARRSPSARV